MSRVVQVDDRLPNSVSQVPYKELVQANVCHEAERVDYHDRVYDVLRLQVLDEDVLSEYELIGK